MLNTPGFSSKKLDIEQPGVETFQRSFPQDSGKFCTLFNNRGHCYVFEHKKFGELGRIVLIKLNEQEMLMQAELYQGQEKQESTIAKNKKDIFEKVVTTIAACFNNCNHQE
jgi:hypothetical protein